MKLQANKLTQSVNFIVFLSGLILYGTQFLLFYNAYHKMQDMNAQLEKTKDVTLFALATLAEKRDFETGAHLSRTAAYVGLIAYELYKLPNYRKLLTPTYIQDIIKSAPLHDIGKVAIPDVILRKPGKLTQEEFEVMKRHSIVGYETLFSAESKLKFRSFLTIAKQMIRSHHEKWNGKGYPDQLSGESIPLSARIMALADVYDAIRSERPYKSEISHEDAVKIITAERGEHFDPAIVDVFLKIESKFNAVSEGDWHSIDFISEEDFDTLNT